MSIAPDDGGAFPLRLCQVLEREFATLHGASADAASWLLMPGDVGAAALVVWPHAAEEPASEMLRMLRGKVVDATSSPGEDNGNGPEERLRAALNRLLEKRELLVDPAMLGIDAEARRLAMLAMEPSSRRSHRDSASRPGSDADATHDWHIELNRLLLEAVLPPAAIARVDARRLAALYARIHALRGQDGVNSAVCLSGGGIRAASYALGVLQGLARGGLLAKFDYLSTVSGGGYVGSWLTTWIHRHPKGLLGVVDDLGQRPQLSAAAGPAITPPEPPPVGFLRDYSHFLNPRAGLFTADTWTWIGIYLRNLSLNWLVIIPSLLVLVALPRLYSALLYDWKIAHGDYFSLLMWVATVAAVLVLVCVTVNRPSTGDPSTPRAFAGGRRGRMERFRQQGWLLVIGVLPLFVFAIVLTLLVWGLPASKIPLSWAQVSAVLAGTPWLEVPGVLAHVGFDHLVLWGELIVLVAWIFCLAALPARDWVKRLQEMVVMLLAGALTWCCVAALSDFASRIGTSRDEVFRLGSFVAYPAHVYAVFAVPTIVMSILAGMTLFIGAVSKFKWIEDEDREWWGRFGAWILIVTVAWIALSAVTIFGPPLLLQFPRAMTAIGGVSGLIAVLLGKSSLTSADNRRRSERRPRRSSITNILGANTLPVLSAIFLAVFLALLSLLSTTLLASLASWLSATPDAGDNSLAALVRQYASTAPTALLQACGLGEPLGTVEDAQFHLEFLCQSRLGFVLAAMGVTGALLLTASLLINLNKFSLHAAYRIRIARTFLGASRGEDRQPNPFTGFDPLDDVQMHELQPGLLREADIVDLSRFVSILKAALSGTASPAQYLVRAMCSRRHDRSGVLEGRLRAYTAGAPVLKSLQKDVLEALNRVLEVSRLDRVEAFRALAPQGARGDARAASPEQFVRHGNTIFANRLLLEAAFPADIRAYDFPPPPPHKLMHVVNLTLNLVHGSRLAWQERKAAPFVVTPMHSGSYYLGYRPSRDYGGEDGISIGTAVAVSGAAVSPNMGYSSSPLTALLLTLFNVRLGWWLGNPGIAGSHTYRRAEPRLSLRPLLSEALGLTDDQSPYCYLSDGGHFDNMGLFEMVLRRCRLIVCTDAGADPEYQFADVGNAVRKIRIDLGIPIEFAAMPIHRRTGHDEQSGRYCALGRIRYSCVDGEAAIDGVLVVFKPVVLGSEPPDVLNYAATSKLFPQEPTLDQFFGESQFESYRKLGEVAVDSACAGRDFAAPGASWAGDFVARVHEYLGPDSGDPAWIAEWRKRMSSVA